MKVYSSNGCCYCGALLPNGTQVVAGYEDGTVRIWDLKTCSVVTQSKGNTNSIVNLYLNPDGKLLVACALKAGAIVLKTQDCKMVAHFKLEEDDEIETAAFCPEPDLPILATGNIILFCLFLASFIKFIYFLGSLSGTVCFWDIGRQQLRHKATLNSAITILRWGQNALIYVSCVDGVIYIFNGRSGLPVGEITGHQAAIMDFQVTKDSKNIVSASDDATCKVFDIQSNITPVN